MKRESEIVNSVLFLLPIQTFFIGASILSEYIQSHPTYYFDILLMAGKGLADFSLGHMGDLGTASQLPLTCAMGLSTVLQMTNTTKAEAIKYVTNTAVVSGIITGLIGIVGELHDMIDISAGTNCGNPAYTCRGDWGDVLSFSVPLIAGVAFLAYKQLKSFS